MLGVEAGEAAARFVNNWAMLGAVKPYLPELTLCDIHKQLDDEDQAYFRKQREQRFGKKLEEARPPGSITRTEVIGIRSFGIIACRKVV